MLTRGFYIPAKVDGLNYGSDFVTPLSGVPASLAPHDPKDKELILWLSHLLFHTLSPASLSSLLSFRPSPRCNPMNDSSYPLTLPLIWFLSYPLPSGFWKVLTYLSNVHSGIPFLYGTSRSLPGGNGLLLEYRVVFDHIYLIRYTLPFRRL